MSCVPLFPRFSRASPFCVARRYGFLTSEIRSLLYRQRHSRMPAIRALLVPSSLGKLHLTSIPVLLVPLLMVLWARLAAAHATRDAPMRPPSPVAFLSIRPTPLLRSEPAASIPQAMIWPHTPSQTAVCIWCASPSCLLQHASQHPCSPLVASSRPPCARSRANGTAGRDSTTDSNGRWTHQWLPTPPQNGSRVSRVSRDRRQARSSEPLHDAMADGRVSCAASIISRGCYAS